MDGEVRSADHPAPTVVWSPHAGPQTALVTCPVFEVFYGGARGGGKTDGVLGEWLNHADRYGDGAVGLMVRRERTQLIETIERSKESTSGRSTERIRIRRKKAHQPHPPTASFVSFVPPAPVAARTNGQIPHPGDERFLAFNRVRQRAGFLTDEEYRERLALHGLIRRAQNSGPVGSVEETS